MADVHIWASKLDGNIWDENIRTYMYLTLCGIHVKWALCEHRVLSEPTCMGCILVRFQQKAEEQDG
jgi:hypothetical protein